MKEHRLNVRRWPWNGAWSASAAQAGLRRSLRPRPAVAPSSIWRQTTTSALIQTFSEVLDGVWGPAHLGCRCQRFRCHRPKPSCTRSSRPSGRVRRRSLGAPVLLRVHGQPERVRQSAITGPRV